MMGWPRVDPIFGPTNQKLIDRVKKEVQSFRAENPNYKGEIPADLLTASGSGLDPDISPDSARAQAARVARARGVPFKMLRQMIADHTKSRALGFIGEPRVNVLKINLDLDRAYPHS